MPLDACLTQLGPDARAKWRVLRVITEFNDFAHAARRLHLSHEELRVLLRDLSLQLGAEHLRLDGSQVRLSTPLRQALQRHRH